MPIRMWYLGWTTLRFILGCSSVHPGAEPRSILVDFSWYVIYSGLAVIAKHKHLGCQLVVGTRISSAFLAQKQEFDDSMN